MGDRYDSLQPPSLIASIASMPRRWKDALRVPPSKNIDELLTMPGPEGSTAAEHLGAAIAQTRVLCDAIRTTSYNVPDPLTSEVSTARLNAGSGPWPSSAQEGLDQLTESMEILLAQLNLLTAHDWNKSADAGRETLSILALTQGASRVSADRLASVEKIVSTLAE